MFSKLIFTIDGQKIELHLHEVVKLAQQIVDELDPEEVSIPEYESLDKKIDDKFQDFMEEILNKYEEHFFKNEKIIIETPDGNIENPLSYFIILLYRTNMTYFLMSGLVHPYSEIIKEIKGKEKPKLIQDELIEELIFPAHISGLDSLPMWIAIGRHLAENYQHEPVIGWWFNIGGRLILIKNDYTKYSLHFLEGYDGQFHEQLFDSEYDPKKDLLLYSKEDKYFVCGEDGEGTIVVLDITGTIKKLVPKQLSQEVVDDNRETLLMKLLAVLKRYQHFYVSDHGFIKDILDQIRYCISRFSFNNLNELSCIVNFWQYFEQLTNEEKNRLKDKFIRLLNGELIQNSNKLQFLLITLGLPEYLRIQALAAGYVQHPSMIGAVDIQDKETDEGKSTLDPLTRKKYEDIFDITVERFRYTTIALTKRFVDQAFGHTQNPFYTQIRQIMSDEDASMLIVRQVLSQLAKEINSGEHDPLFRPVYSYGDRDKGDSYHNFEKSLERYFNNKDHLSESALASKMRDILRGKSVESDDLAFLPNLVGAWFVAEVTRNSISLLTGLMLIDMIESGIELRDSHGNNWYAWINTLIHPLKRCKVGKVTDLYGKNINIDDFGGSSPMAYNGSVSDAKETLEPGEKLSVVHQKEGSLILHWLYVHLKCFYPDIEVELVNAYDTRPSDTPQYDEISGDLDKNPEILKINKKIASLEKDLKLSNDPSSDKNKKRHETLSNLNTEKVNLVKRLSKKKGIIEKFIIPLLTSRLKTIDLLLPHSFGTTLDKNKYKGVNNNNPITFEQGYIANLFAFWDSGKNISTIMKEILSDEDIDLQMAIDASLQDEDTADIVSQRKIALQKCSAAYGYNCIDVRGDGNCFFYAVIDQFKRLGRTGQDIDADILRMLVAVEIDSHKVYYNNFIADLERRNYAKNVARPGEWVGLIAAHALARIKVIIVVIIPSDGGKPQVIKPHGANEVIVLGNEVDVHFQSLIPNNPLLQTAATNELKFIIDGTPVLGPYENTTEVIYEEEYYFLSLPTRTPATNIQASKEKSELAISLPQSGVSINLVNTNNKAPQSSPEIRKPQNDTISSWASMTQKMPSQALALDSPQKEEKHKPSILLKAAKQKQMEDDEKEIEILKDQIASENNQGDEDIEVNNSGPNEGAGSKIYMQHT